MVHRVTKADDVDIPGILEVAHSAYLRNDLPSIFGEWDLEHMQAFIKKHVDAGNVFVINEEEICQGFFIAIVTFPMYNSEEYQIYDIAIQVSDKIPKFSQGRTLVGLIHKFEEIAESLRCSILHISISSKFNIGKRLTKMGYRNTDIVYSKRVTSWPS
jgi:hypothetical protein